MTESANQVIDNAEASRFELRVGEHLAIADYRRHGDRLTFTHTEVPPELRGRGIGGALVRGALDQARARGFTVRPLCPFVAWVIEQNPEYQDLLAASRTTSSSE